ncbi:hypothetical protein [Henriciella sp.]|uniref:hypothetical protein n=1 Tax=Henriciella sp. TaxID=1968823 RepID=UPI0026090603|nr:hypothetical protein [Henriciella sp.]
MSRIRTWIPHVAAIIAALVFLDSLRFKFTNAEETQVIFGNLDAWAASLGADGLFAQTGLFSQYVIGTAELVASAFLLIGILPALRRFQAIGALIGLAVMSGAVNFHLWTSLGIDPNNDGGGLFMMACVVWVISLSLIVIRRHELAAVGRGLAGTFLPATRPAAAAPTAPANA